MAGPVFQYTSLYVKISEGKKLPSREVSSHRNPFCVLKVDNEIVARTATVYRTLEPFWGEDYTLHVPNEFQAVSIHVFDYDLMGSKEPLGRVMLDRDTILKSPRGLDRWFLLTAASKHDDVQGEVLVEIVLTDQGAGVDHMKAMVTVVEARDLAAKSDGKSDPFATLYYNEDQFSTPVIAKTRFPRWKKSFDISIPRPMTTTQHRTLNVTIYNWDKFAHNHFMGQIEIDLSELQTDQRYKTWYRLQHSDHQKGKDKKKELGSLRLKVQCREERILDSQFYTPFVEFMLSIVDDKKPEECAALTALEEVMTMDRNSVAHALVRFYLAHGSVLPLLDILTLREINNTTVTSTLFRGNSLASKSVDQFMKIVALPYLHSTISPVIDAIYTEKKLCELDCDQLRPNNKSSAGKVVESSVGILADYAQQLMESVFSSVGQCPPLLRMALRQLWARVAERFTGPENTNVPYLAVSGFLFLRFFVPAILSPKLFALRDEHPDQRTERTLKLLAKVIQNISNLQEEMEAKEPYMHPMNFMMPEGVLRVRSFIQELVQIDQKEVSAERGVRDGGYIHHLILCKGYLWKRNTTPTVGGSLQYRKRYFELSNIALTYSQNEKKVGDVKSYPVQWIKVTEKLDEGAFHRKHMFQVVIVPTPGMPNPPPQTTLHLQASDVNEQNRWVSAIRKACLTNRDMIPVYHPGAFKNGRWTCCRTPASQEPGCSQCHRGITMGDWRDPLDPDLDAQILFSQFLLGRAQMIRKFMPDDGSASTSTRDSSSPTPSAGATSLGHDEEGGGATAAVGDCISKAGEKQCRDLLGLVDELKWYHEQCSATA